MRKFKDVYKLQIVAESETTRSRKGSYDMSHQTSEQDIKVEMNHVLQVILKIMYRMS